MNRSIIWLKMFNILVLATFGLISCDSSNGSKDAVDSTVSDQIQTPTANSKLDPTIGHTVGGSVSFVKTANGVHITAQLSGLTPGDHGFHIHAKGDCSSGDGKSAGGHFNPQSVDHGGPNSTIRHIGDLGNITADAAGNAKYDRIDSVISLEGANSIIGKGIIIHAGADDLTSQPTGAAGARVACGVIGRPG